MNLISKITCLAMMVVPPNLASAQTPSASCSTYGTIARYDFGTPAAALDRALSVTRYAGRTGSGIFQSAVQNGRVCMDSLPFLENWVQADTVRVRLAPVEALTRGNSAYPRDRNNGALWGGVGLNSQLSAGVTSNWKWLSAAAIPKYLYQANEDFVYPQSTFTGRSQYANPDHVSIDFPKRFGDEAFSSADWGQSFIGAEVGPLIARFSNENLWVGAAQLNTILLSNTAAGFPHMRLGTRHPINLGVLDLEYNVFWGSVEESDYFDGELANNTRLFTGSVLSIEPHFIRGLHLGIGRVYHDPEKASGREIGDYLSLIGESPFFSGGGNRSGNGIGGVYARWVFPASDFEVYTEWTREDTPFGLEGLLRVPDWSQAYMVGFQKVLLSRNGLARLYGEIAHLGESTPVRSGSGLVSYYTHHIIRQGHTHRGQMLGAAIGPGSDVQMIGLEVFRSSSRTGFNIERTRYDEDTYYRTYARRYGESRHDAEITLEARRLQWVKSVSIEAGLRVSRRYDRDFIVARTGDGSHPPVETNWGTDLTLSWHPRFSIR